MICQRCNNEQPIRNRKRQLCHRCAYSHERAYYPPVQPPLEAPDLPRDNRRGSIAHRREAVLAAWKRGYSQRQIARAFALAAITVWKYINTEAAP